MVNLKKYLLILITTPVGFGIVFSSCNNNPGATAVSQQTTLAPPVTRSLQLGNAQNMGLSAVKSIAVHPEVRSFNMDKLPLKHYDTVAFKPVKYQPEIKKFDFKSLPSRSLDFGKLPSEPLKFKAYKLHPPKLIKAGPRHLLNSHASIFELGEAQGLKADTIACTYTDHEGFVWISTNRGLYRYDGENFWLFDDLPQKLTIFDILQDNEGLLWLGGYNGSLEIMDVKKGTVKIIDAKNTTGLNYVTKMVTDASHRIWTASLKGGIGIIDVQHQTISYLGKKEGLPADKTVDITLGQDHNIWVSSMHDGLARIDLKGKKVSYLDSLHGLKTNSVTSLLFDRKGRLWAGHSDGDIDAINFQESSVQTIHEAQGVYSSIFNNVLALAQDRQGHIWAGRFGNGIEVIDQENRTRTYFRNATDPATQFVINLNIDHCGQIWAANLAKLNVIETNKFVLDQIGNKPTTSLCEDYNGLIWRAGDYDGVEIIDPKKKILHQLNSTNGLANDTMDFLRQYKKEMVVIDNRSLFIIDSARKKMTVMGEKQGFITPYRSWAFDKEGKMWMGGNSFGIEVYNPVNNTVKLLGKKEGIRDEDIEDMCTDSAGHIWISCERAGIGVIDPETETIRYIDNHELTGRGQRGLAVDAANNVWVTDTKGLFKLDLANNSLTAFGKPQGLKENRTTGILIHNDQIYAAYSKGVAIITPPPATGNKNWRIEPLGAFFGFDRKNGDQQSDAITRDGIYYMGELGVTAFNLAARDTVSYPAYIAGIKIMDSTRYFAAGPASKANGMRWNGAYGPGNTPVDLHVSYDQNFVQFNYSIVNIARHDTVYYKYRLIGVDNAWNGPTDETYTHNYINLVPGKYTFEVTSMGYNGAWTKPAIMSFTIDPPWWQTWWAYLLYVLLLGGSIWGFSYYRSRRLIKEKRILEHKVHVRTEEVLQQKEEIEAQRDNLDKAFKDLKETQSQLVQREKMASLGELTAGIAHEIQNPLNFVNNFSEVSQELMEELQTELDKGDTEEAKQIAADVIGNLGKIHHHGQRADSIVKGMLEHSRASTGQKEPTDLNKLTDEYLRLAYHGLRAKDKSFNAVPIAIGMITHFDEALPLVNIIPQDIGRVMLNLFNNAFYATQQRAKTAGAGYKPEIQVTTYYLPLQGAGGLKVRDNGNGIPESIKDKIMQPFFTTKPTGEGTGLGLSLSYDIVVKAHGGKLDVKSVEGDYTEFSILLPISS